MELTYVQIYSKLKKKKKKKSNHLGKLGKFFICQHGNMTKKFMTAVSVGADQTGSVNEAAEGMNKHTGSWKLTARGSAWVQTSAGCTVCTETP